MAIDWQTVIAIACVLGAGGVFVRRFWVFLHPVEGSCGGGCVGCGSTNTDRSTTSLISLTLPTSKTGNAIE